MSMASVKAPVAALAPAVASSSAVPGFNPSGEGSGCSGGAEKKSNINPELWQACAGPLTSLPAAGTLVYYFPQGHSEQVAASMKKDADAQLPNYSNLPSKLLCLLHSVTLHVDSETDDVYAQMTLQPVSSYDAEALLRSDLSLKSNKSQPEFFCKTLTASDTSTHGGFSVPRRAAEKIFPPLDFSLQPPAQEIVARDLHDNPWTFRHIYRGQPKRHLLTTGWSLFVGGKRLFAGDSVLFIRDDKQQLLLGIRRTNRQSSNLSSSVLSSDSMHIGILAAAAHAAANNSPFTIFYNPRASPSEFVIPLAKYYRAVSSNQISLGMRFRMTFETEDSGTRRYMGTVTGISDLDPARWKNSQWRNLQVGWDESTAGERRSRVSIWEIEPVTAPFFLCPPPFFRCKRPRQPGMIEDDSGDLNTLFKRGMPWFSDDLSMKDSQSLSGLSLVQWMNMQLNASAQSNCAQPFASAIMKSIGGADLSRQFGLSSPSLAPPSNTQVGVQRIAQQQQQIDQFSNLPVQSPHTALGSVMKAQQPFGDVSHQTRLNLVDQTRSIQPEPLPSVGCVLEEQQLVANLQPHGNLSQSIPQQQQMVGQPLQPLLAQPQFSNQVNPPTHSSENQIQFQFLQKLQQQQESIHAHKTLQPSGVGSTQLQDLQKQLFGGSQCLSKHDTSSHAVEAGQMIPTALPISDIIQQQISINNNHRDALVPNLLQQTKVHQQCEASEGSSRMGFHNTLAGYCAMTSTTGAGQSIITDEGPSGSTSPSSNNCRSVAQQIVNIGAHHGIANSEDMAQSAASGFAQSVFDVMPSNADFLKNSPQRLGVKPSMYVNHSNSQGFFVPPVYQSGAAAQADYLDTSSSTTSLGVSHIEVGRQHNNKPLSYVQQSMVMKESREEGKLRADHQSSFSCGTQDQVSQGILSINMLGQSAASLSRDISANLSAEEMLGICENPTDLQQELPSMSQQFAIPDMPFNSTSSTMNEGNILNRGPCPSAQLQPMRTYKKVYKRGAVGRLIDITRYSGYDELKQDLARRFGIEGQLEDKQRIGWKLVYVDHENDILLVGDDPWEEFVNCVRCIKILSPQEVQQMSLDGDIGTSSLPNQACSSSDNGEGWP